MLQEFALEKEKIYQDHRADAITLKVVATKSIAKSEKKNIERMNEMEAKYKQLMENLKTKHKVELEATKTVNIISI